METIQRLGPTQPTPFASAADTKEDEISFICTLQGNSGKLFTHTLSSSFQKLLVSVVGADSLQLNTIPHWCYQSQHMV